MQKVWGWEWMKQDWEFMQQDLKFMQHSQEFMQQDWVWYFMQKMTHKMRLPSLREGFKKKNYWKCLQWNKLVTKHKTIS